ncbi:MAG TPA: FtsX-like permease family protein, partial [Candidatus Merdenecus merdavium]|nr:FtsX-like permease family protein [Candidatus Merdenecus merdavium]
SWPIAYSFDEPQHVLLKTSNTDVMSTAGKKCADILNEGITSGVERFSYKSKDIMEQAKKLQELSSSTNQQLLWIASISLLVGGIGVMNIMLVSVTERTREIGLKKAIGARKGKILVQFLTEASVLTSLGGLLGVGCGIILSEVISKISEVQVAISVSAIVGSVAFSMFIGIVFGLLPSIKAANLNPIDALRHE